MQMSALEKQYHEELKREFQGAEYSTISNEREKDVPKDNNDANTESVPDEQQIAKDADNMSKMVMSRKRRNILEAAEVTLPNLPSSSIKFNLSFPKPHSD